MVLILYKTDISPPCRAVYMTARALGITLNMKEVNLDLKEQYESSFLKMNPQHTVPTLDDDGAIFYDSHAINTYLVQKFGQDDSLYPKDLKKRTVVDQRLYFDTDLAFSLLRQIVRPIIRHGIKVIPDEKKESIHSMFVIFETLLSGQQWAAGETVTVADICLIATISTMNVMIAISEEKYPNITAWIKRCQSCPWYAENRQGLEEFRKLLEKLNDGYFFLDRK